MDDPAVEQLRLLLDLDARHDSLLEQLEELEQQVARALVESQVLLRPLTAQPATAEPRGVPARRAA